MLIKTGYGKLYGRIAIDSRTPVDNMQIAICNRELIPVIIYINKLMRNRIVAHYAVCAKNPINLFLQNI